MTFAIKGMHHFAYKCFDPVKTRFFYETVLGMPLAHTIRASGVPSTGGDPVHYFHFFFEMRDGSCLAFFDLGDDVASEPSPNTPRWVNHIALEVESSAALAEAAQRLQDHGFEVVGPIDHGFIRSIYFFDPNGIRMEFTWAVPREQRSEVYEEGDKEAQYALWLEERPRAKEFARTWALAERGGPAHGAADR
jgi:catechol 2,3-dioxygenase-like lactoylglutathione lyase family enzyme